MPVVEVSKQQLDAALAIINQVVASGGLAEKAVATNTAQYGHGPGGTFSLPQLDQNIYNAMQLPVAGLAAQLPIRKTNLLTPLFGIVTGQTATSGSEPTDACQDWPEAGLTKLCANWAPMSTEGRSGRKIDLVRVGAFNDRSDHMDFNFLGDPFKVAGNDLIPAELAAYGGNGNFLNNELAKQYRELAVSMYRDFAPDTFTGNPASNPGTGNGRAYFKGLDLLINTGYKDAITGQACPASDSIVESFNSQTISSAGSTLVLLLDNVMYRLNAIADETGTGPVKWAFVMRRSLFHELTEIWPCSYMTTRCSFNNTGNTNFIDSNAAIALRDELRAKQVLRIAGEDYPVIIDDAVSQTNIGGGVFESGIYIVPLTIMGGVPTTYWEFFDFNGPGAAGDFIRNTKLFGAEVMGDGRYLMTIQKGSTCFSLELITRRRLLLRTPYLAARITNVRYSPTRSPERSPFPTDAYYVNGGVTQQLTPGYFYPSTV